MRRFAVIKHAWHSETVLPVHQLLGGYHWEAISDTHVLLIGDIHLVNMQSVDNHPAVWLLPSVHSSRPLAEHARERAKYPHFITLGRLGISEHHTTMDLAEIAYEKFGSKFALDR